MLCMWQGRNLNQAVSSRSGSSYWLWLMAMRLVPHTLMALAHQVVVIDLTSAGLSHAQLLAGLESGVQNTAAAAAAAGGAKAVSPLPLSTELGRAHRAVRVLLARRGPLTRSRVLSQEEAAIHLQVTLPSGKRLCALPDSNVHSE